MLPVGITVPEQCETGIVDSQSLELFGTKLKRRGGAGLNGKKRRGEESSLKSSEMKGHSQYYCSVLGVSRALVLINCLSIVYATSATFQLHAPKTSIPFLLL